MIATVYDTKHAIAMTADNGAEILMHIGLDTVQLEGAWNVGIKDYKAHVTISSKRIHEAMDDMDDTYYPKRHGFLRYAKTCFEHYGEYVKYWLTFNEIDSIHRHSFITAGIIPDLCGEKGETQCCYQALHHPFVAAAKAAILLRKIVPDAKIGSMITKLMTYPYTCAPEDVAATQLTVGLRIALIELYDRYRLAVDLPEEEAANIAFYIINTQNDDINHDAMRYAKLVGKIVKLVIYIMCYKPDKESIHYYIFKSIFPWQLCQNNRYKHQRTSYQFSLA